MGVLGRWAGALALLGVLLPSISHAQPAPLEPSTPWKVDYAESECRLLRTFGSGDQAITLRLARGGNTEAVDMVVAGPGVPKLPQQLSVEVKLDPQGAKQSVAGYSMALPGASGRFVRWFDADMSLFGHANQGQVLQLASGQNFSTLLNLGNFRAAFTALDTCYADLLQHWGATPEDVTMMLAAKNPLGNGSGEVVAQRIDLPNANKNPEAWLTSADYPTDALRQEQSGDVTVALKLNAAGQPIACNVVVSSGVVSLDDATCKGLKNRAKYMPPLDSAGQARSSVRIERIRWQIPSD